MRYLIARQDQWMEHHVYVKPVNAGAMPYYYCYHPNTPMRDIWYTAASVSVDQYKELFRGALYDVIEVSACGLRKFLKKHGFTINTLPEEK